MPDRPPPRAPIRRRARRVGPTCEPLEARELLTVTGLTLSASPSILRPISPRNQPHAVTVQHVLPVTLAGEVVTGGAAPTLTYQVVDSDGRDQPGGPISPRPVGPGRSFYNLRIGLSDLRNSHDRAGRRYTIVVTADDAGGGRQAFAVVTVPPPGFFTRAARGRHRLNA